MEDIEDRKHRKAAHDACVPVQGGLAPSGLPREGIGERAHGSGCDPVVQHDSLCGSRMRGRLRAKMWRRPWELALVLLMCTWPRYGSGQTVDVSGVAGTVHATAGHQHVLGDGRSAMHAWGEGLLGICWALRGPCGALSRLLAGPAGAADHQAGHHQLGCVLPAVPVHRVERAARRGCVHLDWGRVQERQCGPGQIREQRLPAPWCVH